MSKYTGHDGIFAEYEVGKEEPSGEKINYAEYCRKRLTKETDTKKRETMNAALRKGLAERNIHGKIHAEYYTEGIVVVYLNGEYYNAFDANTGKWFSGSVGDYKN